MLRRFLALTNPIFFTQVDPGGGGGPTPPVPPAPTPPDPVPPAPVPPPPSAPPGPAKTFTQEEVNGMMAREKAEGRSAAERDIAERFGCTLEEAKEVLDGVRAATDLQKSEAQREIDKAKKDQEDAAKRDAAAQAREREANIVISLVAHGVTIEREDDGSLKGRAARIAKLLDAPADADAGAIATAVAKLKEDEPALFTAATPTPTGGPTPSLPRPPDGTPPGTPPVQPVPTDALGRGAARAEKVNEDTKPFDPLAIGKG